MLSPVILLLVLATSLIAYSDASIFDDLFNPGLDKSPQFSDSMLYLLSGSDSVGLNGISGYIGCFGDFNSDKYTDLFVVVGNGSDTRVDVYLWNKENWEFVNSSASIAVPYITNIAAGDFDYDGKLDLLVSGDIAPNNTKTNNTVVGPTNSVYPKVQSTTIILDSSNRYVKVFQGDLTVFGPVIDSIESAAQVSIVNINNDPFLDLFGEIAVIVNQTPNVTTTELRRVFWINKGDGLFSAPMDDPNGNAPLLPLRSNAFVDIDGDCLADRFVFSQSADGSPQYELLINNKGNGYSYSKGSTGPTPLPRGAGQVSFADFDKDGTMDFIIPISYPIPNGTYNSIRIIFNKQKPLCSLLKVSSSCRSSTALCTADPGFHLGVYNTSDSYFQEVVLPSDTRFYFNESLGRPLSVRVGDFNLDGYPICDTGPSRIELWQNVAGGGKRIFQKLTGGVDALTSIPDAYAAGFFDLDEDGVVDMFVLADNPPRIETIYNNFENDAFFLKTLGLNGVCTEWCPSSPKFPSPKPYGVNFVGAVFKYQYTDLSGKSQLATGTQLPQSSYLPLNTPYILFGLGRTSNYIEQFFFGVPKNSTVHYSYWTGSTIPNSQVVAVPYKYDNPAGWTLELYITPSGLLFWILIALVASLIFLGIVVYVFYRKEKNEDKRKKKEQAHLFSFDAL